MSKKCLFCGKEIINQKTKLRLYCSDKCKDKAYYCRNQEGRRKYAREYKKKNFERDKEKARKEFKKWYQKNKERHNKNVLNYYYKNKAICNERKKTGKRRKEIFAILPNICANCGKKEVNVIHHKEYGHFPKQFKGPGNNKENLQIRKEYYEKYLLLFCSQQCHVDYERKIKQPKH